MVNGDREHLEPSEDNSNNYTRERLTLQSYIETKKILLPIIILSTKNSWNFTEIGAPSPCARPTRRANNNNSPIREEQRQQPHFAQPTSVLLFLPFLPQKKTCEIKFHEFFFATLAAPLRSPALQLCWERASL